MKYPVDQLKNNNFSRSNVLRRFRRNETPSAEMRHYTNFSVFFLHSFIILFYSNACIIVQRNEQYNNKIYVT